MDIIAAPLTWYVILLISVSFHEVAHALVGSKLGDANAKELPAFDPIFNIKKEPFGMIVFPLLSYIFFGWLIGWTRTPFNMYWASQNRKRAAIAACSGPAANLLLMIIAAVLIRIGVAAGIFFKPAEFNTFDTITTAINPGLANSLAVVVSIIFSLNLILLIFNLMPLPPFDGSNILYLLLNERTANNYAQMMANPFNQLLGLFVIWNLFFSALPGIGQWVVNITHYGIT